MNSDVMRKRLARFVPVLLLAVALTGHADTSMDVPVCKDIAVDCGQAPSAVWRDGILWVAFVQGDHLYVTRSTDKGEHFSKPARVNSAPETIETNGENRPIIAFSDQALLLAWTQKTEGRFTGDIRFSRSIDGGKSFTAPITINDDGQLASHRFVNMIASPSGTVHLTWLDKRNKIKAQAKGEAYSGSAVYYAQSTDRGATFSDNRAIADNSCECCRLAVAPAADDGLAIFWRQIYHQNTRDHAFAIVSADQVTGPLRATRDDWQIDACPHHGPDMASAEDGYHLAWFSDGNRHSGILYGLHDTRTQHTRQIRTMDKRAGASHPQVIALDDKVWFAWKLFDGEATRVQMAQSNDGGRSWSDERTLAITQGSSDHPLLIKSDNQVWLTWLTQKEGFRVLPVEGSVNGSSKK